MRGGKEGEEGESCHWGVIPFAGRGGACHVRGGEKEGELEGRKRGRGDKSYNLVVGKIKI